MRSKWILLALPVLVLGLSSCKRLTGGETTATPQTEAAVSFAYKVRTVPLREGTLTDVRTAPARIEPARDSRLAAAVGGRVTKVYVSEGDRVHQGQVLVQLDDKNYRTQLDNAQLNLEKAELNLEASKKRIAEQGAQLKAQLKAAQDNVELTRRKLDEVRALLAIGGASEIDVQNLEVALQQAEANLAAADAAYRRWLRSKDEDLKQLALQVEQARVAVRQAEQAVRDARITAPFDGEVAERYAEVGAFVGPGAPVARLIAGPQDVQFKLPPDEVARLDPTSLKLYYLGTSYPLELERTSPVPAQDQLVRLTARPAETADLPFGASGTVEYKLTLGQGTLVPAAAVRTQEGRRLVYVPEDGRAVAYPVEVVAEARGTAAVRGLEGVSEVIYPVPQDLSDGEAVEVLP
ncbi:efflux RND transporter periplasmic adaptor subunit [Oceanithermus sp.]